MNTFDEHNGELILESMDLAAIRKAKQPKGWRPYLYEKARGGLLIIGCMSRPKTRGPNKGQPHWDTSRCRVRVLVTAKDVDRARKTLTAHAGART
jgi:hypothetical protein